MAATLRDQALINRWLGGSAAALAHALPLLRECASDPLRVLDVGCGGGDVARALADALPGGREVAVAQLDANRRVLDVAIAAGREETSFVHADARRLPFRAGSFDLVLLTSLLHHLSDKDAARCLAGAREVCRGAIVATDVVRSEAAALAFAAMARAARMHPATRHDGCVSLRHAWSPEELVAIA